MSDGARRNKNHHNCKRDIDALLEHVRTPTSVDRPPRRFAAAQTPRKGRPNWPPAALRRCTTLSFGSRVRLYPTSSRASSRDNVKLRFPWLRWRARSACSIGVQSEREWNKSSVCRTRKSSAADVLVSVTSRNVLVSVTSRNDGDFRLVDETSQHLLASPLCIVSIRSINSDGRRQKKNVDRRFDCQLDILHYVRFQRFLSSFSFERTSRPISLSLNVCCKTNSTASAVQVEANLQKQLLVIITF